MIPENGFLSGARLPGYCGRIPGRSAPGRARRQAPPASSAPCCPRSALPATWNLLQSAEKEGKDRKHFWGDVISFPAFGRW